MRVRPALAAIGAALGVLAAGCGGAVSPDDSSEHAPHFVRLSENGPAFLDYDGEPTLETSGRDWPVSLIFTGDASIAKVKSALRSVGLTRSGLTNYLAYRVGSGTLRFDADKGLKTPCDSNGTDVPCPPLCANGHRPLRRSPVRVRGCGDDSPRSRRRLLGATDRVRLVRGRRTACGRPAGTAWLARGGGSPESGGATAAPP